MRFTYESYIRLIELMRKNDYVITSYEKSEDYGRCIILRHDVDYCLQSAYRLAQIEHKIADGIKSTYFLLLTSDFYNVFSLNNVKKIEGMLKCGHEIGLHFDETKYSQLSANSLSEKIMEEAALLSKAVGTKVTKVSMHRPSKSMLAADLKIPGFINTYSDMFCHEFKYLSDSRRFWREPIEDIIKSQQYNKIQILMHPFWYNETEKSINESVRGFVNSANRERYKMMDENISDLHLIMDRAEIYHLEGI